MAALTVPENCFTLTAPYPKQTAMKYFLLSVLSLTLSVFAKAQNVAELPVGKYDAVSKTGQSKWEKGDLILIDDTHYKLSTGGEPGEYRFSVAAQRIFFTSGPLKSAFTRVTTVAGKTVIILPAEQNGSLGISTEVWASKQ